MLKSTVKIKLTTDVAGTNEFSKTFRDIIVGIISVYIQNDAFQRS